MLLCTSHKLYNNIPFVDWACPWGSKSVGDADILAIYGNIQFRGNYGLDDFYTVLIGSNWRDIRTGYNKIGNAP